MGTWETDYVAGTRIWTREGMALFGLALADDRGQVGGDDDEYRLALHRTTGIWCRGIPQDWPTKRDSFTSEYRVVWPDGTTLWAIRGLPDSNVASSRPPPAAHPA